MHADVDAFFASVEQLRCPALKGKPVIVGAGVIASCSYEARRYGLHVGMPLTEAKERCPEVTILDGHYQVYRYYAGQIFDMCRDLCPSVETYLDDAYCDLTGTEALHGHPAEVGSIFKERVRRVTGLAVTVGIGPNRMVARIASSLVKPDGLKVVEHDQLDSFLIGLPVEKLPGVGWKTAQVFATLNIKTVGDLRELSRAELTRLLGRPGSILYSRALGRDTRVIEAKEVPHSISRETSFHRDTSNLTEIRGMLYYLTERAARAMRSLGLKAKTVTVKVRYAGGGSQSMARSLPLGTSNDNQLFKLASRVLGSIYKNRANLHLVGVALSSFQTSLAEQGDLYAQREIDRNGTLFGKLDVIRNRYGHSAVVAGPSVSLLGKLRRDSYGFILRTPSLTK
jgi:nucleotidyltransferase/DNA polymerase involved in DNA repair